VSFAISVKYPQVCGIGKIQYIKVDTRELTSRTHNAVMHVYEVVGGERCPYLPLVH
jgi:hypothetical protein